jgi:nucleoside-diphosphate kinase
MEITLALIKPDAMKAGHFYEILEMMKKEFIIGDISVTWWGEDLAAEFYQDHEDKLYFQDLVKFTASGPVAAVTLIGEDAIARWRRMIGATDPAKAEPGTIRYFFGHRSIVDPEGPIMYNAVHGSDSSKSVEREISTIALGLAEYESLYFGQLGRAILGNPKLAGAQR